MSASENWRNDAGRMDDLRAMCEKQLDMTNDLLLRPARSCFDVHGILAYPPKDELPPASASKKRGLRSWFVTILAAFSSAAHAQAVVSSTVMVVADDYTWGYRCGIKQPVGHTLGGVTIHNISRENGGSQVGSPDYLVWVDEGLGTAEVLELGHDDAAVTNPGGMAQFGPDGTVWFALGGRANDLPFDIMHSGGVVLDDFVTSQGSTTQLFHAFAGDGLHIHREGASSWASAKVRITRWDLSQSSPSLVAQEDIASGVFAPEGKIGIEQLWSRHDPRYGVALTWQWWHVAERRFGSHPFVWSDDHGVTWKDASGATLVTPIDYTEIDSVLVPFDHVGLGVDAEWHPRDLGFTPQGAPWMTCPDGAGNVLFCRWDGSAWAMQTIAAGVLEAARPYACGTVDDYLVFAYALGGDLYARVSTTGVSWSVPTLVDSVGTDTIGLVSCCQPAEYADNVARFLVGHYQGQSLHKKNYEQALRLVRLTVRAAPGL